MWDEAEHIMAVFSDSTRAMGLSGYWDRRESITETNIHRKISTLSHKKEEFLTYLANCVTK